MGRVVGGIIQSVLNPWASSGPPEFESPELGPGSWVFESSLGILRPVRFGNHWDGLTDSGVEGTVRCFCVTSQLGMVSVVRLDKGLRGKSHARGTLGLAVNTVLNREPGPQWEIHTYLWNDDTSVSLSHRVMGR